MKLLIPVILVALLGAWWWFLDKQSGHRTRSPLWLAFSSTALAVWLIGAGVSGYAVSRHARFVAGSGWSGEVIWWEVALGAALVPLAFYFWRRGLSQTPHRPTGAPGR